MNAPAPVEEAPQVVGLRVRPALPIFLYVLLVAAAALALLVARSPGTVPPGLEVAAPWIFLGFVVGFAAYRFALVMARRYSFFKAFFQVGVAVVFFLLLFPGAKPKTPSVELPALLEDRDARVRALAAEVAGLRPAPQLAPALVKHLADDDARVREEAHAALVRLNEGTDLGPADEPSARAAWENRFR